MSRQTVAKANQATGVVPAAPWRISTLKVLPNWQLSVTFNDGLTGLVDVSELINNDDPGIFIALREQSFFMQAYLDYGAVAWPNGADLAPDTMYKAIRKTGLCVLKDE